MKGLKKFFSVAMILCLIFVFFGCEDSSSASKDKQYTEEVKNQVLDTVGYPNLAHYFEASQLKEIYELRDDPKLVCYWYTKNDLTGRWVYEGKCIGYGIPYSASYTAPETTKYDGYYDSAVIPQSEPNGIYTNGMSTSATWILAIDEGGNIVPEYVESAIRVSQYKIRRSICEEWSLSDDY